MQIQALEQKSARELQEKDEEMRMYRSRFEKCHEYIKELKREHSYQALALSGEQSWRCDPVALPRFRLSNKFMIWPMFQASSYVQYPDNEQLRRKTFAELQPIQIGASLTSIYAKFGSLKQFQTGSDPVSLQTSIN